MKLAFSMVIYFIIFVVNFCYEKLCPVILILLVYTKYVPVHRFKLLKIVIIIDGFCYSTISEKLPKTYQSLAAQYFPVCDIADHVY